jgi:hypothetical protein
MGKKIEIVYNASPTAAKFHADDTKIRALMGPIRTGKSVSCVIEGLHRAGMQARGKDGKRRTRWLVVRNCYDDQTEILTAKRGWQLFKNLLPNDAVATRKNNKLTFEVPTLHYSAPYTGELIGIQSQNIDLLVTPDHHLWVSKRYSRKKVWQDYEHVKVKDIYGIGELHRMTSTANYDEGHTAYSVSFFEFLGFWFAEGYAGVYPRKDINGNHYRLVVSQKGNREYVETLLTSAGFEFGRYDKGEGNCNYTISTKTQKIKQLINQLSQYGKALTKKIPEWIKAAPKEHLSAFLQGYEAGDGHTRVGSHDTTRLYTSSKQLADDLHELIVKTGRAAVVNTVNENGHNRYLISILTDTRSNPVIQKRHWCKKRYSGNVYCVEVSTHVVYVRRHGKAIWCGQTYGQLKDTVIKTFLAWVPPGTYGHYKEHPYPNYQIQYNDVELEVWFRALDRLEHVQNLLSMEYTFFWVNEARELSKEMIDWLESRAGQFPPKMWKPDDTPDVDWPTWYGGWMDTNPPDEEHWWYQLFEKEVYENPAIARKYKLWKVSREENEHNLPVGYYDELAIGKDDEWKKVYIEGQYGLVIDGKAVYPDYSDPYHCREDNYEPVAGMEIVRGWDLGNTLYPAVVFLQLNQGVEVFDELILPDTGVHQLKEKVIEYCGRWYPDFQFIDYGDPAMSSRMAGDIEERTAQEILASGDHPINIMPGHIAFTGRREAVKKLLMRTAPPEGGYPARPFFRLSPRCRMIRAGFKGRYQYPEIGNTGRYHESPMKNMWSHPHDALQYAITGLFTPYEEKHANTVKKYIPPRPPSAMAV